MSAIQVAQMIPPFWMIEDVQLPARQTRKSWVMKIQKRMGSNVKPARMTEEWEVIQRALGGDSDALSKLFSNEQLRLYRSALALLRNKEDAEDALQHALLSAYVKLSSFEGRSRFSTWLTRIVFNAALMNRRKVRTNSLVSLDELTEENPEAYIFQIADTRPNPEQVFRQLEIANAMQKAMNRMSPLLRSALHLRDIQRFTVKEAAKHEGVTTGVLKARSLRARRQLADLVGISNTISRQSAGPIRKWHGPSNKGQE